jgi:hypothetical protein
MVLSAKILEDRRGHLLIRFYFIFVNVNVHLSGTVPFVLACFQASAAPQPENDYFLNSYNLTVMVG